MFCPFNLDSPTRLPYNNNPGSSPDVSIASAHLLSSLNWSVLTTLNSDHLPIIVSFLTDDPPPRLRRSFTNFKLADWPGFLWESEELISGLDPLTSCARDAQKFSNVLLSASKHNIPSGFRKDFIPGLPNAAKDLIRERDDLHSNDPSDPALPDLNARIEDSIKASSRKAWREEMEASSHNANSEKFWSLLKRLSGKSSRPPPNQPISFKKKTFTKAPDIANKFCSAFTKTVTHKSDHGARNVLRKLRKKHKTDPTFAPFTPLATQDTINQAKSSSATGPDGLTAIHLKHIGPRCIAYLTDLFNLSDGNADLPALWKLAVIVPILKPGKLVNEGSSYRLISLLCPAVKVLERLLLPIITSALPKSSTQHGFAPLHSCTTALLPIVTRVAVGFNDSKPARRSAMCVIDISKAFYAINHPLLLAQISDSDLHPNIVRWLAAYIRGRTAKCSYDSAMSKSLIIRSGVP
jgi:hypothetical protein